MKVLDLFVTKLEVRQGKERTIPATTPFDTYTLIV